MQCFVHFVELDGPDSVIGALVRARAAGQADLLKAVVGMLAQGGQMVGRYSVICRALPAGWSGRRVGSGGIGHPGRCRPSSSAVVGDDVILSRSRPAWTTATAQSADAAAGGGPPSPNGQLRGGGRHAAVLGQLLGR
jgi:hypothetical protein